MCVDATGVKIAWDPQEAGVDVMQRTGTPLPDSLLASIRRTRCALKAPITTPVGKGFRSVNVQLRQEFDLYACVRPCKFFPGVRTFFSSVPVDLVIVRENTEDLYAGIEFEAGAAKTGELIDYINRASTEKQVKTARDSTGISIKPISVFGSERIVRYAFEYARANGRKKVTAVHKANIMKHTDGLFLATARKVAAEFPDIEFEDRIVDNMCMQLVQKPELYDVLVLPNLYGDILSDVCRRPGGRAGCCPRGEYRRQRGHLRGHPRQCPQVQGVEQGQSHGPDSFRGLDAAAPEGEGSRRAVGAGRGRRDRRGSRRDLRLEAQARRSRRRSARREMAQAICRKMRLRAAKFRGKWRNWPFFACRL